MEDNSDNILYQRQVNDVATKTKTKLGRPPTRLQKHAPSSLQLVQNPSGNNANIAAAAASSAAPSSLPVIPLLSPLVVSPKPLPLVEAAEESKSGNDEQGGGGDKGGPTAAGGGGWHHPAVPGYTDPSIFFTFFQSKCLLVNDA